MKGVKSMKPELKNKVAQIHVSLKGSSPLIWRRFHVPAKISLRGLHRVLQGAMPWKSCHLYIYKIGDDEFGDPEFDDQFEWKNDQNKKLYQVFNKTDRFTYIYDFGDGWQHEIKIEQFLDPSPKIKYPVCLEGENAAPPEDSGGIGDYGNLKQALADPTHPEHEELSDWVGPFYTEELDLRLINKVFLPRRHHLKTL
jgi:hypothetical protein